MHQSKIRELKRTRDEWRKIAATWEARLHRQTGWVKEVCQQKLDAAKQEVEKINRELGRHV